VLSDVTHEMRIMREETFGPVLPIMPFDSDDEAVQLANDCEFGLAASVWTQDRKRGEALARRIQAGTVMVNDVVSCFGISEAPHGGVKASGLGRTHGRFGLDEMVRNKICGFRPYRQHQESLVVRIRRKISRQMEGFLDMQFARALTERVTRRPAVHSWHFSEKNPEISSHEFLCLRHRHTSGKPIAHFCQGGQLLG